LEYLESNLYSRGREEESEGKREREEQMETLTRDETITSYIGSRAGFEEHVTFIEEQDGIPLAGELQDQLEGIFDFEGRLPEFACAHRVQRLMHLLGH
jgi:hypothetical protein